MNSPSAKSAQSAQSAQSVPTVELPSRVRALLDTDLPYLTDGGLETTLVFHDEIELPEFAAYHLVQSESGRARLRSYSERYLEIARSARLGFVLETPTWRAGRDWGRIIGTAEDELLEINRRAVEELLALRRAWETEETPIVVSGNVGPRGDGYRADEWELEDHLDHHLFQVRALAGAGAEVITALTMTTIEEATSVVLAARQVGLPSVISFTVETDGRIPSGESLREAIEVTDDRTGSSPIYYMVNCAHPTHFGSVLEPVAPWTRRIGGLRANASRCSHAELDEATTLDEGDPREFGAQNVDLFRRLPDLKVLGGCCGTDHRHIGQIVASLQGRGGALRVAS